MALTVGYWKHTYSSVADSVDIYITASPSKMDAGLAADTQAPAGRPTRMAGRPTLDPTMTTELTVNDTRTTVESDDTDLATALR